MSHPQQCLRSQVFLDTFSEEFLSALTKFCRPIGLKWPRNNNEPAPSGNNPNPEDRAVASTLAGEMCAVACFSNTVVPCQAFAIVAIPTACCTGNSGIAGFVGCWAAIGAAAFANGVAATGFTYVVVNRCNEALMDCVRGDLMTRQRLERSLERASESNSKLALLLVSKITEKFLKKNQKGGECVLC